MGESSKIELIAQDLYAIEGLGYNENKFAKYKNIGFVDDEGKLLVDLNKDQITNLGMVEIPDEHIKMEDIYLEALTDLGDMYERGKNGVERDCVKAIEYYKKAAEAGNAYAMGELGKIYINSDYVVEKDYVKAIEYCRKAANSYRFTAIDTLFNIGQNKEVPMEYRELCFEIVIGMEHNNLNENDGRKKHIQIAIEQAKDMLQILTNRENIAQTTKLNTQSYTDDETREFCKKLGRIFFFKRVGGIKFWEEQYLYDLCINKIIDSNGNLIEPNPFTNAQMDERITIDVRIQAGSFAIEKTPKLEYIYLSTLCHLAENLMNTNITKAVKLLKKIVDLDKYYIQEKLNNIYKEGYEEDKDYEKLAKQLEYNIKNNNYDAESMYELGYLYEKGFGVNKNIEYALSLYKRSAELGNSDAINRMGLMYYYGVKNEKGKEIVKKDKDKASEYFQEAVKKENTAAMNNLGYTYVDDGVEIRETYKKAFELFTEAKNKGDLYAKFNLGVMYLRGDYKDRNDTLGNSLCYEAEVGGLGNIGRYTYHLNEKTQPNIKIENESSEEEIIANQMEREENEKLQESEEDELIAKQLEGEEDNKDKKNLSTDSEYISVSLSSDESIIVNSFDENQTDNENNKKLTIGQINSINEETQPNIKIENESSEEEIIANQMEREENEKLQESEEDELITKQLEGEENEKLNEENLSDYDNEKSDENKELIELNSQFALDNNIDDWADTEDNEEEYLNVETQKEKKVKKSNFQIHLVKALITVLVKLIFQRHPVIINNKKKNLKQKFQKT